MGKIAIPHMPRFLFVPGCEEHGIHLKLIVIFIDFQKHYQFIFSNIFSPQHITIVNGLKTFNTINKTINEVLISIHVSKVTKKKQFPNIFQTET